MKKEKLNEYVGKDIKDICDTGYDAANVNHCAHFVSHALDIKIGLICGNMKFSTKGKGASIRVNEIYNECTERGEWDKRPQSTKTCLAFTTLSSNINNGEMGDHPRKHIGIFVEDKIWHYSNRNDKVTTDSPESFINKFKGVYGFSAQLYFGVLKK
jgi:hypothetical protein